MAKRSAGLLMYRGVNTTLEVFLVHPGGPFFVNKDQGAWSIPKGEYTDGEEALAAAIREFTEETGFRSEGPFHELGSIRQSGGKLVSAWAFQGDCDPAQLTSNLCQIEWPPRSGRFIDIPEVDRGRWFSLEEAAGSMVETQQPLLVTLQSVLRRIAVTGAA